MTILGWRPTSRGSRTSYGGCSSGNNAYSVGMRRIESPTLVAWAAAFVGLIGVVSASTPEMADRFDFVRGVLPQGFPTAARVLTLAFGLALLWLSRRLPRRQ